MGISHLIQNSYWYVSYKLVYGKSCHFPVNLQHKAVWELKKLNLYWGAASSKRVSDMNDLDKVCLKSYSFQALYQKKIKKYYHQKIQKRELVVGDWVLGCTCFLSRSSPSGTVHSKSLKYSHMQGLVLRTSREQG